MVTFYYLIQTICEMPLQQSDKIKADTNFTQTLSNLYDEFSISKTFI